MRSSSGLRRNLGGLQRVGRASRPSARGTEETGETPVPHFQPPLRNLKSPYPPIDFQRYGNRSWGVDLLTTMYPWSDFRVADLRAEKDGLTTVETLQAIIIDA